LEIYIYIYWINEQIFLAGNQITAREHLARELIIEQTTKSRSAAQAKRPKHLYKELDKTTKLNLSSLKTRFKLLSASI
jgi:hypothetical protein